MRRRIAAAVSIVAMLALAILVLPVVAAAFRSARGLSLPYPLVAVLRELPLLFPLHMAASACALLLVPLAIASWRVPRIHRWIGGAAVSFILVGALASFAVAVHSAATPAARAGFFCQGLVWLALAAQGVRAIRGGRRTLHASLMRATAIVTFSPLLLRLLMHVAVMSPRSFDRTYACLAWGVWLVPLLVYGLVEAIRASARRHLAGGRTNIGEVDADRKLARAKAAWRPV